MAMTASAFDTLTTARDLEAAGFERRQAEAVASAIGNAGDRSATKADLGQLATKAELGTVRAELGTVKADVRDIKADNKAIKAGIADLRTDIAGLKGRIDGAKWGLGLFLGFLAALGIAIAARIFGAF